MSETEETKKMSAEKIVGLVVVGVILVGGLGLFFAALPDISRYMKMKNM